MSALPAEDMSHLQAAEGWLFLGSYEDAFKALDDITPSFRTHADVLVLRCEIFMKVKKWDYALALAEGFLDLFPDDPRGVSYLARIHRERGRVQSAYDIITMKLSQFPMEWKLYYDAASYASILGKLDEADMLLSRAFELGDSQKLKLQALDDPDLDAVWTR